MKIMLLRYYFLFKIFLTSLFQTFYSQTYHFTGKHGEVEGSYKPGALQVFEIKVSDGAKVVIQWNRIGLDGRMPQCDENYIEVLISACSGQPYSLSRFCQRSEQDLPNDIYGMDHCIKILFYTQANDYMNNTQIGFKLTYSEATSMPSNDCFSQFPFNIMATKNWPQSYSQSSGTCNEKVVLSADKALKIFLMSVDTQSPKKDQCDGIDTDSLLIKSAWECGIYHTDWNDDGGGHVTYLDRHSVDCPTDQVIGELRLERNNAQQFRYLYKCCPVRGECQYTVKNTESRSSDFNAQNLKHHKINCGTNAYVSGFKLRRSGDQSINYDYTCCSVPTEQVRCENKETKQTGASKNAYDLHQHDLICSGSVIGIQSFQLLTHKKKIKKKMKTFWSYSYKCCVHDSPVERIMKFCGKYEEPHVVGFTKETVTVDIKFTEQSFTQHNRSGILLGYTTYDAEPDFYYGETKYLIPFTHGHYYVAEYNRTANDPEKQFKELHIYNDKVRRQEFQIVPGLKGCDGCVSLRSISMPYEYIFAYNDEALFAAQNITVLNRAGILYSDFQSYASFRVWADKYHKEFVAFELADRPDYYLVVDDNRVQVRKESGSNINNIASFRLSNFPPVIARTKETPKEQPYWIIGIVIVSFVLSIFVKNVLVSRHNLREGEIKRFHKKLLEEAASDEDENENHPSAYTNNTFT